MQGMQTSQRSLFSNFGIWPTTIILSYFTPLEVIEISRVNKEAHYISKKVFETRKVELHKISLRLVKFFHRAHMIRISKDSVQFFDQFKEKFFQEILVHYRSLRKFIINLNYIFGDNTIVEKLFSKLAKFTLDPRVKTIQIEDGVLSDTNLRLLSSSKFFKNIVALKLPRCNLGDNGVTFIFNSQSLSNLKKVDVSSNNITHEGVEYVAEHNKIANLEILDLRNNKIGTLGYEALIKSSKF